MCHKIGYYLQKMHQIDMMKVRVDFYMDVFSKIWLLETTKLFIRKARKVPTEGSALLANFALQKMYRIEEQKLEEEKKKRNEERKAAKEQRRKEKEQVIHTEEELVKKITSKEFFIQTHPHYFHVESDER